MFQLLLEIMPKTLTNLLFIFFIYWLQEGLLTSLNIYLPLLMCVVALFHLYRLENRWLVTFAIGTFIEITSVGFSGQLLGLLVVGIVCQVLFSFVSHAHDQFYVVVVGPAAVLVGEVVSHLSVNIISNQMLGNDFIIDQWSFLTLFRLIISAVIILFIGKKLLQKNYRYA